MKAIEKMTLFIVYAKWLEFNDSEHIVISWKMEASFQFIAVNISSDQIKANNFWEKITAGIAIMHLMKPMKNYINAQAHFQLAIFNLQNIKIYYQKVNMYFAMHSR